MLEQIAAARYPVETKLLRSVPGVVPNARLCKALLDRVTDRAHIIETGTDSYRFRRTMEKKKNKLK